MPCKLFNLPLYWGMARVIQLSAYTNMVMLIWCKLFFPKSWNVGKFTKTLHHLFIYALFKGVETVEPICCSFKIFKFFLEEEIKNVSVCLFLDFRLHFGDSSVIYFFVFIMFKIFSVAERPKRQTCLFSYTYVQNVLWHCFAGISKTFTKQLIHFKKWNLATFHRYFHIHSFFSNMHLWI